MVCTAVPAAVDTGASVSRLRRTRGAETDDSQITPAEGEPYQTTYELTRFGNEATLYASGVKAQQTRGAILGVFTRRFACGYTQRLHAFLPVWE